MAKHIKLKTLLKRIIKKGHIDWRVKNGGENSGDLKSQNIVDFLGDLHKKFKHRQPKSIDDLVATKIAKNEYRITDKKLDEYQAYWVIEILPKEYL